MEERTAGRKEERPQEHPHGDVSGTRNVVRVVVWAAVWVSASRWQSQGQRRGVVGKQIPSLFCVKGHRKGKLNSVLLQTL